jgi:hypothetical protein
MLAVLTAAAVATSGHSFFYVLPISLGISVLLCLIRFSYRQTIHAYPSGGGIYIVAMENLAMHAGLTAASALLVNFTLTVAVSVSSGVAAITSAARETESASPSSLNPSRRPYGRSRSSWNASGSTAPMWLNWSRPLVPI